MTGSTGVFNYGGQQALSWFDSCVKGLIFQPVLANLTPLGAPYVDENGDPINFGLGTEDGNKPWWLEKNKDDVLKRGKEPEKDRQDDDFAAMPQYHFLSTDKKISIYLFRYRYAPSLSQLIFYCGKFKFRMQDTPFGFGAKNINGVDFLYYFELSLNKFYILKRLEIKASNDSQPGITLASFDLEQLDLGENLIAGSINSSQSWIFNDSCTTARTVIYYKLQNDELSERRAVIEVSIESLTIVLIEKTSYTESNVYDNQIQLSPFPDYVLTDPSLFPVVGGSYLVNPTIEDGKEFPYVCVPKYLEINSYASNGIDTFSNIIDITTPLLIDWNRAAQKWEIARAVYSSNFTTTEERSGSHIFQSSGSTWEVEGQSGTLPACPSPATNVDFYDLPFGADDYYRAELIFDGAGVPDFTLTGFNQTVTSTSVINLDIEWFGGEVLNLYRRSTTFIDDSQISYTQTSGDVNGISERCGIVFQTRRYDATKTDTATEQVNDFKADALMYGDLQLPYKEILETGATAQHLPNRQLNITFPPTQAQKVSFDAQNYNFTANLTVFINNYFTWIDEILGRIERDPQKFNPFPFFYRVDDIKDEIVETSYALFDDQKMISAPSEGIIYYNKSDIKQDVLDYLQQRYGVQPPNLFFRKLGVI